MPTWEELQGYLFINHQRLILRLTTSGGRNSYFYQTTTQGLARLHEQQKREARRGEVVPEPNNWVIIHNEKSYTFVNFKAKGEYSRIYNHVNTGPETWGWVRVNNSWIAYKTIKIPWWSGLPNIASPTNFHCDPAKYYEDPFSYKGPDGRPRDPREIFKCQQPITAHLPIRTGPLAQGTPDSAKIPERREPAPSPKETTELLTSVAAALSPPETTETRQPEPATLHRIDHIRRPSNLTTTPHSSAQNSATNSPRPGQQKRTRDIFSPSDTPIVDRPAPFIASDSIMLNQRACFDIGSLAEVANLVDMDINSSGPSSLHKGAGAQTSDGQQTNTTGQTQQLGARPRQPTTGVSFDWVEEEKRNDMDLVTLQNPDVQKAGKLNADIRNLENAIRRNLTMLMDGYPVVLPGRSITTPHPELINADLIAELNERMTECAIECSKILVEAQSAALVKLKEEREDLGQRFRPTARQVEEMTRIRDQRTYEQRSYTRQPRGPGPLTFFTPPDLNRGQRFIGVNRQVSSYLSTGRRFQGSRGAFQPNRRESHYEPERGSNQSFRGNRGGWSEERNPNRRRSYGDREGAQRRRNNSRQRRRDVGDRYDSDRQSDYSGHDSEYYSDYHSKN